MSLVSKAIKIGLAGAAVVVAKKVSDKYSENSAKEDAESNTTVIDGYKEAAKEVLSDIKETAEEKAPEVIDAVKAEALKAEAFAKAKAPNAAEKAENLIEKAEKFAKENGKVVAEKAETTLKKAKETIKDYIPVVELEMHATVDKLATAVDKLKEETKPDIEVEIEEFEEATQLDNPPKQSIDP